MIKPLKQRITKLGLACTLAMGCSAAATAATVLSESTKPAPAYADGWYQSPVDILTWYYLDNNGIPKTGWQKIGGKWYYFNNDGEMARLYKTINGKQYYFSYDGAMWTGWLDYTRSYPNYWCYYGNDGALRTGWQWIGGKWYYFNHYAMVTGWQSIGGKWYYFNDNGAMQTGWIKGNYNIWYYCNKSGAMVTGWNKVGSTWYYHNKSGEMQIGWQQINGVVSLYYEWCYECQHVGR